ncbi:Holo-[acyl-carrier-protein] synthase [Caloramator mitchellensis]|uniref:Holo-[acyl-carrier-protein] synthase n=1 Tax=Caloramator mitchellensis TaxID=908809 RepID=A0A0R3JXS7_CALMK|nr:holo-ACP synthase [Caloramator mitchellensis]KRQ87133.1 Holo-[acyl-carrier-protein] synthase [Caloramator mitchellensis]
MIIGIGTDIIEIDRIKIAIERSERFKEKIFTDNELSYLKNKNVESYAGYFCAKEAISKALGTGISGFSWKDIEILKINSVPNVRLHNAALQIANQKGIKTIHISISHSKDYAIAMAVAEG